MGKFRVDFMYWNKSGKYMVDLANHVITRVSIVTNMFSCQ